MILSQKFVSRGIEIKTFMGRQTAPQSCKSTQMKTGKKLVDLFLQIQNLSCEFVHTSREWSGKETSCIFADQTSEASCRLEILLLESLVERITCKIMMDPSTLKLITNLV